ncbi:MAG: hypothetical protein JO061_23455 [Acidobacteriaceae bacterium]|nr:hypothetical protein [Acidobacteriaceae bacterium]
MAIDPRSILPPKPRLFLGRSSDLDILRTRLIPAPTKVTIDREKFELIRKKRSYSYAKLGAQVKRIQPNVKMSVSKLKELGSVNPNINRTLVHEDARVLATALGCDLQDLSMEPVEAKDNIEAIMAVFGLPGFGKTTLIRTLAHRSEFNERYPLILSAALGREAACFPTLQEWCSRFKCDLSGVDGKTDEEKSSKARDRLIPHLMPLRLLVLIDDAWTAAQVQLLNVGSQYSSTVVTTRIHAVAAAIDPSFHSLQRFSEGEGLQLLEYLVKDGRIQKERASAGELVENLEGHPLGIEVAARFLQNQTETAVKSLLNNLANTVLSQPLPHTYDNPNLPRASSNEDHASPTVNAVFKLTTDTLPVNVRRCFAYLGLMPPEPHQFPSTRISDVWESLKVDVSTTIRMLLDRGLLIRESRDEYSIHSLLKAHAFVVLNELKAIPEAVRAYQIAFDKHMN